VVRYVTLYLDESGGKEWPPPWGRNESSHYVLTGPVLTPEQDHRAQREFEAILERQFPDESNRPSELHYGDIVNGRGPWFALSREQRKDVSDEVWAQIIEIAPTLIGTVVRKSRLKERYGDRAMPPNEYALTATCDRFHRHLIETDGLGMILMDTENMASQAAMQKIVHAGRRWGGRIGGIIGDPNNPRLERILNTLVFTPSHMSAGVQMADFVAYATWSHFERNKGDRFREISELWRQSGTFTEPSVVPK
jgi:hypothetical protein